MPVYGSVDAAADALGRAAAYHAWLACPEGEPFTLDMATATLYVPTANPAPAFAAKDRKRELHSNAILALDARTGAHLWHQQVGAAIYAPPATFLIEGRQFVVVPAGTTLTAFALPTP